MDHRATRGSHRYPHLSLLKTTPNPKIVSKCNERVNIKAILADVDISQISGNVSDDDKKFCLAILRYFVSEKGISYGAEVGASLVLSEVNIRDCASAMKVEESGPRGSEPGSCMIAETVFEITCSQEMCNVLGILHGACAAYIVDMCSASSLVVLGTVQGFDGTGVSQSMNLIWHHPIRLGQKIRVVSTAVSGQSKIRTMRSELWADGRLCISSVHSTINVPHSGFLPHFQNRDLSNNNKNHKVNAKL